MYTTQPIVQYFCNNITSAQVAEELNMSHKEQEVGEILKFAQVEWDNVGSDDEGETIEQSTETETIEADTLEAILSLA